MSACRYVSEALSVFEIRIAMGERGLSARAHNKILRVNRTIADVDGSETITAVNLSEAINHRTLDRTYRNG